ncbi:cation transporter [Candidatus Woesearchaeota archaeon]|nr:cation transporter [Candidatus Woesearchaeota archaeon]
MNILKLRITGMHCEACEKTLKKALSKLDHVKDIDIKYSNELAKISYNPEINVNQAIDIIRQVGYDATVANGDYSSDNINIKGYLKNLKNKEKLEGNLIYLALGTLLVLGILEVIAYYGFFIDIPNFFNRFGYYIIFLIISVVVCGTSIWHIKAYGNSFSCMSGMMVGMTIGMISGFLIGMIVGATNGMFIGSVAGILIGMFAGSWTGKCCGVMGIMEGMMAGLMGGLMGAMTSLMLLNDNLKIIIPILVTSSVMILIGLDYMIYKETVDKTFNKPGFMQFITFCFIVTMALTFLMIYGPKSLLFQ